MFPIIFPAVALLGAIIQLFVEKQPRTRARVLEVVVRWLLVVAVGVAGILDFIMHTLNARATAEMIGFPPDNPFQWEVAFADLAIGVLGLACLWRRDFWWPAAIAVAVYFWGCAWGHIYQLVAHDNHEPGNAGVVLYLDILVPLAVLVLLYLRDRAQSVDSPARRAVPEVSYR
jgi:peptidoglycan/LPS O-acetylase OafA/YrhL